MAPHSGPITPPTVIADCMVATWRRTSPGSSARPALMNANVEAAPISPTTRRDTKISGSVRAMAMAKNAPPCRYWMTSKAVLGFPRPPIRPSRGAVTTVASGEMPRIQPVQRRVVTGSSVEISWMWKGRLT